MVAPTSDRAVNKADQLPAFKKVTFNCNPSSLFRSGFERTVFRGGSPGVNSVRDTVFEI